jgi:hypothetical protein
MLIAASARDARDAGSSPTHMPPFPMPVLALTLARAAARQSTVAPSALAMRGSWGMSSGNWDRSWVCAVINGATAEAGSRIG